jgi:tRNA-dihydrouridine synthase 3
LVFVIGVAALMAGRGALIKPWLFFEWAQKKSWHPTAEERVAIYYRLATYFKVLAMRYLHVTILTC